MTTCFLAPDPIQSTQFIPGGNTPANGGQLFFYQAGSSTKQTVYKDNAASVAWTNPIVLDSGGNLPNGGEVWFPTGITFKAVFAPSTDTDPPTSPYWTKDNLAGINDTSASQSEWATGPAPTFVTGSQFTLSGDQTGAFVKSRRLKFTVTAGTVYGTITRSSFAVNTTTVDVAFAAGALDAGLNAVSYSLLAPDNPSINTDYANKQASSVASASTTNIWGVAGNSLHVTGTNAIFSFSTTPYTGAIRELIFDGAMPLVHNASTLVLPASANVTTAVGDSATIYADTGSTRVLSFRKAATGIGGNSLVFIASSAAASSASLDITGLSGFASYEVYLNNLVPATVSTDIFMRASTSNGANFDTTANYSYVINNFVVGAGGPLGAGSVATTASYIAQNVDSLAGYGVTGKVAWNNLNTTSRAYAGSIGYRNGNTAYAANAVAGFYNGGPMNALRVQAASGNLNAGSIYVYGVRAP
jgi:hypothetical protein